MIRIQESWIRIVIRIATKISVVHAPPLQKFHQKSTRNPCIQIQNPKSGYSSGSPAKSNRLVVGHATSLQKFHQIPFITCWDTRCKMPVYVLSADGKESWNPGSTTESGWPSKSNRFIPGPRSTPLQNFIQISSFWDILHTHTHIVSHTQTHYTETQNQTNT